MKSEIIKHLRLYRNGSSRLDFILDCHDEIIELKRNNRIISQRIKQLEKYPVHRGTHVLCVPQLTHNLVMLHGQNDANDLIERLKNKQNENGLKILKLRKLL
jgi:hypothetical protein